MSKITVHSLLETIIQSQIVEPKHLEAISSLQPRSDEPEQLALELINKGWLTSFQAEQLLQGKSQQLVLGPYIVMDKLGEGGMGQVYKARHGGSGKICAIKVIRNERLGNPNYVRRFLRANL